MAEWTNIFDLGEWQIYLRFRSAQETPTPNSRSYWVKAEDLNPAVGSVSIVAGDIVCDMGSLSGSSGLEISVYAFPLDWSPDTAQARVSGYDLGGEEPFFGGTDSSNAVTFGTEQLMYEPIGGVYLPDESGSTYTLATDVLLVEQQLPDSLPSGYGLFVTKYSPGF